MIDELASKVFFWHTSERGQPQRKTNYPILITSCKTRPWVSFYIILHVGFLVCGRLKGGSWSIEQLQIIMTVNYNIYEGPLSWPGGGSTWVYHASMVSLQIYSDRSSLLGLPNTGTREKWKIVQFTVWFKASWNGLKVIGWLLMNWHQMTECQEKALKLGHLVFSIRFWSFADKRTNLLNKSLSWL